MEINGRDATRFLEHIGVADLSRFPVGRIRHFVMTDHNGKVTTEGVLGRMGEDAYYYTAGGGEWIVYQSTQGDWDVTARLATPDFFIFELQGPMLIDMLESSGGVLTASPLIQPLVLGYDRRCTGSYPPNRYER